MRGVGEGTAPPPVSLCSCSGRGMTLSCVVATLRRAAPCASVQKAILQLNKRHLRVKHRNGTLPTLTVKVCGVFSLLFCTFVHLFFVWCTNP